MYWYSTDEGSNTHKSLLKLSLRKKGYEISYITEIEVRIRTEIVRPTAVSGKRPTAKNTLGKV